MKALLQFIVNKRIWSKVLILLVFIAGMASFSGMRKSFFPEIEGNDISINVVMPGASPLEMEEGITYRIENAIEGIEGIVEINSTTRENSVNVKVEIDENYDMNKALTDVKNAVDQINGFPSAAEKPNVTADRSLGYVMTMAIYGEVSRMELKDYAQNLKDELDASENISQITIGSIPPVEIAVEVNEAVLSQYNITFDEIAQAVSLNNRDISGGTIKTVEENLIIRSYGKKFKDVDIANIILRTNVDGSTVRVGDICTVKEQFTDSPFKVTYNGQPAVDIYLNKLPTEDIVLITEETEALVERFNAQHEDVQAVILNKQATYLQQRIDFMNETGLISLILVIITLGLFLNLRLSLWVAFGIPFSFLGMAIFASMFDITINQISLFGMILVIGILVDDAIVVGESIFAELEKGKRGLRAAVDGALDVLPAVFTSVITTIIAFSTFFFLGGRIGAWLFEMAIVVIACLIFSLIESTFVLPSHLSHMEVTGKLGAVRLKLNAAIEYVRVELFGKVLIFCIRHWYAMIAFMFAFVIIMVGVMQGGVIGQTFFPSIEGNRVQANLILKSGTPVEKVEPILEMIEEKVWEVNEDFKAERGDTVNIITSVVVVTGTAGGESGAHTGNVQVSMIEDEDRGVTEFDLQAAIRKKVGVIPQAEKFGFGYFGGFGKPVSMSLTSNNLEELDAALKFAKEELAKMPELTDIDDNNAVGTREIIIELKPEAHVLGLTHNEIARQIRQGFFGEEIQRLQKGEDEVRIWVRYPEESRKSLGQLENMKIRVPQTGAEFPLNQLINYEIERGIVKINHVEGRREVRVEASLTDPKAAAVGIINQIKENTVPKVKAQYPGVQIQFRGQALRGERFNARLGRIMPVILVMMYFTVVVSFGSFGQSVLIFLMIIPGVFCGILGHGFHGMPVSILSYYGFIALSGIIINDSVVFLDKFNKHLKEGQHLYKAIYNAGLNRFRPIVLTSITTVAGLFPVLAESSFHVQFLKPMAVATAYGVLFGTSFILLGFPALIIASNRLRNALNHLWTGKKPSSTEYFEPALREQRREIEWEEQNAATDLETLNHDSHE